MWLSDLQKILEDIQWVHTLNPNENKILNEISPRASGSSQDCQVTSSWIVLGADAAALGMYER